MHHQRGHPGRAAQQHRSTDRHRAGGRERLGHQPRQTALVVRRAGLQHPRRIRYPRTPSEKAPGAVIHRQDAPAPVQVKDADPRGLEQGGHGRVPRLGTDQRLPDADELTDMGH